MIIQVKNLVKKYGDVTAVDDVTFEVEEGSLFSFLGTNGAGKSTTIGVLTTLLKKTSGSVTVGGFDVDKQADKVKGLIGIVFQDNVLDKKLSVCENLTVRGNLYGLKSSELTAAIDRVIETTGMTDYAKRQYGKLSGGQRRRADIARALINMPKILFLDEPTTGLDPKTRQDIWRLIRNLQKQHNMTVFLTTHYMEEAAESDNVIIIHKGKIKAQGTPAELKQKYTADRIEMDLKDGKRIKQSLKHNLDAIPIIKKYEKDIAHFEVICGSLDDAFIRLTEQEVQDDFPD